jgi:hypothetical protein
VNPSGPALAGRLCLMPGRPLPTVQGARPVAAAARLARGRPAHELPGLLAALFTLCAQAHRLTARHAVQAACGENVAPTPADRLLLQEATAREQVLRITHDWPRRLPGEPVGTWPAPHLPGCPLWRHDLTPAGRMAALPGWLAHHWLGLPLRRWLQRHERAPGTWARQWCERTDSPPAWLLHAHAEALQALATPQRALRVLDQPLDTLPELAHRIAGDPGFCARPDWRGHCADTGPWTRRIDAGALEADNAWMRLIARFVDVLCLAAPGGATRLSQGALPLPGGAGIAWTEMARGLLVHWVRLEPGRDGPRVADCRVLAPTEWNFHPHGLLAQALAGLRTGDAAAQAAQATRLAVAFDPCVDFSIDAAAEAEPLPAQPEPTHA